MNKSDLVADIATMHDMSHVKAKAIVDYVFICVVQCIANGEDAEIHGFGRFSTTRLGERNGRNPQTGEPIKLPAKVKAKFTPAKALKQALNGG